MIGVLDMGDGSLVGTRCNMLLSHNYKQYIRHPYSAKSGFVLHSMVTGKKGAVSTPQVFECQLKHCIPVKKTSARESCSHAVLP